MSFWDRVKNTATDLGDKIQKGSQELGEKAQIQIEKAQQSEAAKRLQQGSAQAWERTKGVATSVRDKASEALMGKTTLVTFLEPKLGMTLSRDDKGQPVVSRVDQAGAAETLGVAHGDVVVAIRAGSPGDGSGEPSIKIETYDQLMGLFPAMGRPVSITFLTPKEGGALSSTGGVVNFRMEDELEKASLIVSKLTADRSSNPDAAIPREILRKAKGLAFIRVAKLGFGVSVKVRITMGDSLTSTAKTNFAHWLGAVEMRALPPPLPMHPTRDSPLGWDWLGGGASR
eukprot:CAMPEP_0172591228 /NCGR_PEP_ID=MMETSP1068-20121228/9913_1 /TAXON_ID=35684 /ORGANISM="Pseudopedinella elastica, Strain CCMP716" /LENGTH=285 /DNA_ID=CAMNT_0013387527 /DNA_START=118 /DNA_END=971 /DNA_ORIENTATION=+